MRPGRVLVVLGSVVMGLAVVGLGVGVWLMVRSFTGGASDLLTAPVLSAPVDRSMTLTADKYLVYEAEGSGNGNLVVTVVPEGTTAGSLPVTTATGNTTLDRAGQQYRAVAGFQVPTAGPYQVRVDAPPGTQLIVAHDLMTVGLGLAAGFVVVIMSGLGLLVGVVLLVIGLVRASRARRQPPPGWYPPPGPPGVAPPAGWNQSPPVLPATYPQDPWNRPPPPGGHQPPNPWQ